MRRNDELLLFLPLAIFIGLWCCGAFVLLLGYIGVIK